MRIPRRTRFNPPADARTILTQRGFNLTQAERASRALQGKPVTHTGRPALWPSIGDHAQALARYADSARGAGRGSGDEHHDRPGAGGAAAARRGSHRDCAERLAPAAALQLRLQLVGALQ